MAHEFEWEFNNDNLPNAIIIDNFYKNPDSVREYATRILYEPPENHGAVGYRSESGRYKPKGIKECFERILNRKIKCGSSEGGWDYSTNGCFQFGKCDTPVVYHCDSQDYAGIIYLTPDAPPSSGTSFYRHSKYKISTNKIFEKPDWSGDVKDHKYLWLDKRPWEKVDSTGNVYNRLVLFKGSCIHSASEYFGDNMYNSRLYQLFFFNFDD